MDWKHIVYKNHLGPINVLLTESCTGKYPTRETLCNDREIFDTHIWIHNNVVKKMHVKIDDICLDDTLTDERIYELFKINI